MKDNRYNGEVEPKRIQSERIVDVSNRVGKFKRGR